MLIDITLVLFAYLLGSLSAAIIVCRMLGLSDPRSAGSGNPGATNILRLHGKKYAAMVFAADMLKGVLPVILARSLGTDPTVIALTGLAAFSGHLYPVFFGFRGGKGVATLGGVLLGTAWLPALLFGITWLVMAAVSRYSSLSALVAATLAPAYVWFYLPHTTYAVYFGLMAMLLVWRHRRNIQNLLAGTEPRLGKKNNSA